MSRAAARSAHVPAGAAAHRTVGPGRVVRINGPVVEVEGLAAASMFDLVSVGAAALPGEVVGIRGGVITAQVYGYTGGLRLGEPATCAGHPLQASLGPGLLGGVFDGVLRPLGGAARSVPRRWRFEPSARAGAEAGPGALLGSVAETGALVHRICVPPRVAGRIEWLSGPAELAPEDAVAVVGGAEVRLANPWPVRRPRPARRRLDAAVPLATGQRVLDALFPVARGSTAAVPGGFGTGKTLLLQQIAKWCDADVIVYVGCGERGNEMADVLEELPTLEDPRTGRSLMERTVILANTSNMPVMAREASVYTGMTVAEYFRDMGLDAVVIADSTSRWAEALREFASRTDQLPAEEGFPAGLASSLAAFYERAGRVVTLGGAEASVTVIASVSPPGADMTEPVTAHTRRFVRCLWSLDRDLAYARHYPAVSWRDSFSRDVEALERWYAQRGDAGWAERRAAAMTLLAEADRIEPLVQLIGAAALPDRERVVLGSARLLREGVLAQNAGSSADAYCAPAKQAALVSMALAVHAMRLAALDRGVPAALVEEVDLSPAYRARDAGPPDDTGAAATAERAAAAALEALA